MQFWPPASRPQNRRLPWPEVTSPIFSMYWLLGNIFNKLYEPAEFEMMSFPNALIPGTLSTCKEKNTENGICGCLSGL